MIALQTFDAVRFIINYLTFFGVSTLIVHNESFHYSIVTSLTTNVLYIPSLARLHTLNATTNTNMTKDINGR